MTPIPNLDPFALGGHEHDSDAEIFRLFQRWLEACAVIDRFVCNGEDDGPDWNGVVKQQCDIEDEIFASRGGPAALAIKVFINASRELCVWTPSASQIKLDPDPEIAAQQDWIVSMLRDAAQFVPEIGELAAAILDEDAALIALDMDIQWAIRVLGEPPPKVDWISPEEWGADARERLREARHQIATIPAKTPRGEAIKAQHRGESFSSGLDDPVEPGAAQ